MDQLSIDLNRYIEDCINFQKLDGKYKVHLNVDRPEAYLQKGDQRLRIPVLLIQQPASPTGAIRKGTSLHYWSLPGSAPQGDCNSRVFYAVHTTTTQTGSKGQGRTPV